MISLKRLRRLSGLFIGFALVISGPAFGQDDFCSQDGVPARIFANIPVTTAGNLQDFLKTNDLERIVTIEQLFAMTPEIAKSAEASLQEVEDYLAFLNKYYGYMLEAASENIGRLISERLMGELDALYFQTSTRGRRIYFATHSGSRWAGRDRFCRLWHIRVHRLRGDFHHLEAGSAH